LDSGYEGVETDLCKIADQMFNWEEELSVPMKLTIVDISTIKGRHPLRPVLQRCVCMVVVVIVVGVKTYAVGVVSYISACML
jgi:hypothetical protein